MLTAGGDAGGADTQPAARALLPGWLHVGAAWSWRLIVIGIVSYYLLRFLTTIELVVMPFLGALVFTALLRPMSLWLQRQGLSRLLATWVTFFASLVAVLGAGTFVVYRAVVEWHTLTRDLTTTTSKLRHWLATGPLHLKDTNLKDIQQQIGQQLGQHRGAIVNGIVSGASIAFEIVAGVILCAFITFFLLYDGERIWRFVRSPLRPRTAARADKAAGAAWQTLSAYLRGSLLIATFHAVVMAVALLVIGVPLVAPLVLVVFVTSFVPLVGVLVGGGLAVFVTAGTHGLWPGVALVIVLVVEHQIEGHLLQPLVMGRYVRLHPLAIALALAVGGLLQGILGAIVAVPVVAVVHAAWPHLRESELSTVPDDPPPPGHVLVSG